MNSTLLEKRKIKPRKRERMDKQEERVVRKRWWKRINRLHIYIACETYFWSTGTFGLYLGLHAGSIGEGYVVAPNVVANIVALVGIECLILACIGIDKCRKLKKKYIQEQREEENRALGRCA